MVIAIIGILAALLFPGIKSALAARDESVALSNMRQIGVGFNLYANDHSYLLPGRAEPPAGSNGPVDKWPALIGAYLNDFRVFASSYDKNNWIIRGLPSTSATSSSENNTSYIMNGYNDLGTFDAPNVQVRINAFPSTSNIILLGTPMTPNTQFYMDFEEAPNGNQYDVLQLAAFNGGSNYLFADGSAKFITQAAYVAPDPNNPTQRYGDDLWCVNKSYVIPKVGNGGN